MQICTRLRWRNAMVKSDGSVSKGLALVQITHYTTPNYTDHPQVNTHWIDCIENVFTVQDFWATCACPEIFHCIEYIFYHSGFFWTTLCLPWKQILPWNFSLYWILLHSGFLSNFALALINRVCPECFHCIAVFFKENVRDPISLILGTRW